MFKKIAKTATTTPMMMMMMVIIVSHDEVEDPFGCKATDLVGMS